MGDKTAQDNGLRARDEVFETRALCRTVYNLDRGKVCFVHVGHCLACIGPSV